MKTPVEYTGVWMPEGDIINNISNRNIFPMSR